ncbi:MAG: ATP--guanido phosphotransferase [Clostridia bacterium]|nr:ATP--guanido phosphotransferase [Clostridia bacterium]
MSGELQFDTVVSSRVRFARNIADYPFFSKLTEKGAKEIIDKVGKVLGEGYTVRDFTNMSAVNAEKYVEDHVISQEFAQCRLPHALYEGGGNGSVRVMVIEEDHIRIQSIIPGAALDEAYKAALECDERINEGLNIAYSDELGYLTHCPTNLGTAMRASVMMFLPGLQRTGRLGEIVPQLSKLGMTIRGMYGEGSESGPALYQISNQITLGVDEETVISKLKNIVGQIADYERKARKIVCKGENADRFADALWRSVGILKYARTMSSDEFMKHYQNVRLGVSEGLIDTVTEAQLDCVFSESMPANVVFRAGKPLGEKERDLARAEYLRETLKAV